jgi:type I restriction enzyme, S subunit
MSAWEVKKLSEVAKLINGKAYKKTELLDDGPYRVLRVGNFFTNNNWYYSDLELPADKYCDNGDLLYAWSASFGPRIWEVEKVIFHYHIWKVEIDPLAVIRDFLFYFFEWDVEKIKTEQGAGTTMIHVTKGAMEERQLLVPPITEQKRIVAILDEAFEGLATAAALTQKKLQNAQELFQSTLQSTFQQKGKDWTETTLDKLCSIKHGFAFKSQFFSDQGELVLLTPGNFYESGGYRDRCSKTKYYNGEFPEDYLLSKDDFLFAMTEQAEGLLGSSIIVPESNKFLHNQRLGLIQVFDESTWDNRFFYHQFNTIAFRDAVQDSASGAKVRHTSPTKLGAIKVSYPPLPEQKSIVKKLDALSAATRELEALYQSQLTAYTELKQSLLHQAFSGKL